MAEERTAFLGARSSMRPQQIPELTFTAPDEGRTSTLHEKLEHLRRSGTIMGPFE